MKNALLILALLSGGLMTASAQTPQQVAYSGVGPVEEISTDFRSLPENAQTFINELFPATTVTAVKNDVADSEYEVDMSNGYEVVFNYDGDWIKIDAPDNVMLPSSVVKQLVSDDAIVAVLTGDQVVPGGVIDYVGEIACIPDYGYVVEYEAAEKGKVAIDNSGNVVKKIAKGDRSKCCRKDAGSFKSKKGNFAKVKDGKFSKRKRKGEKLFRGKRSAALGGEVVKTSAGK